MFSDETGTEGNYDVINQMYMMAEMCRVKPTLHKPKRGVGVTRKAASKRKGNSKRK